MATYVADTHALLWYLSGDERLGEVARAAFDASGDSATSVLVPAIVLAEALMMIEKRRVEIDTTGLIETLTETSGFQVIPLLPTTVLAMRRLSTLHDIHDRLIVAEALAQSAALITRDQEIQKLGIVQTVW